jgi:argininosuccinate lyase
VQAIEIPESKETDLSPILAELKRVDFQQAKTQVEQLLKKLEDAGTTLDKMRSFFTEDIETIKADIQKLLDVELETEVQTVGPDYQFLKTPVVIKRIDR